MKSYLVTFAPRKNAPAGNLGKPDYFGFLVEAVDMGSAEVSARDKFERAFGSGLTDSYSVTKVEVQP